LIRDFPAPGRHSIRATFHQRLMDLREPAAVDPPAIHQVGSHAAAAAGMAAVAVVLPKEPRAGRHRLRVVVVPGGARIIAHQAFADAGRQGGIDNPEMIRLFSRHSLPRSMVTAA
jgi:hypothetical protein